MKHAPAMAWTIACAVLFYWLISYAAISLVNAEHNPVVTHYQHKVCPATQRIP